MKNLLLIIAILLLIIAGTLYLNKDQATPVEPSDELYQGVSDNSLEGYYEMSQQINSGNQTQKSPDLNMSEVLLNKDDSYQNLDNQTTLPVIQNEGGI